MRRSRRPPDDLHQFGHGKEIYFWTLVVAVLLFAVGGGLAIYEGLSHSSIRTRSNTPLASYIVLAISFALEVGLDFVAIRELEPAQSGGLWRAVLDTKDASVLAVLVENIAAMVGLVLAFLGLLAAQLTGDPRFDALGSLAVGVVLMAVAVFLAARAARCSSANLRSGVLVDRARTVIESDEAVSRHRLGADDAPGSRPCRRYGTRPLRAGKPRHPPQIISAPEVTSSGRRDPLLDDVTIEPATRLSGATTSARRTSATFSRIAPRHLALLPASAASEQGGSGCSIERLRPGWRLIGYDLPIRYAKPSISRGSGRRLEHVHVGWQNGHTDERSAATCFAARS